MNKKNNNGYILITTLLLLLVLTIVGLSAIGTSTVENALSGNTRLRDRNQAIAEAGGDIAYPLITHIMENSDTAGFTDIVQDNFVIDEITLGEYQDDNVDDNPDIMFTVDTDTVSVDIDRKRIDKMAAGAIVEFASGYEGLGQGVGGGSSLLSYIRINSRGKGLANSESDSGTIYRYVPGQ